MGERLSAAFWHPLVFGSCGGPLLHKPRRAAYLIAEDDHGQFACERGPSGALFLVGGALDAGESPEAAVVREVREEAAAGIADLRFVGALREWFVQANGVAAWDQTGYFFVGTLAGLPKAPPPTFVWAPPAQFLTESFYASARYAVTCLTPGIGRTLQPA